jgi:PKD repeat protein
MRIRVIFDELDKGKNRIFTLQKTNYNLNFTAENNLFNYFFCFTTMIFKKSLTLLRFVFQISTFLLLFSEPLDAQNVNISGIINSYGRLISYDTCDARLNVTSSIGFEKNQKIIIIQMNGASIQETNNSNFGTITNLGNTGLYEVNEIDSVAIGQIFLRKKLLHEYSLSYVVQVVSMPVYNQATVVGELRAKPWDGNLGGVLALEAATLTLDAHIDASGTGFRGAVTQTYDGCEFADPDYNDYFYALSTTSNANGARKGESVSLIIPNKECGKGASANGGGGGNNHRSGGGGGGNTGRGGKGGNQLNRNLFGCNGNDPGAGGFALQLFGLERLFVGGGGGAGHNRSAEASTGGNGGGLVLLKVGTINANNRAIRANGAEAVAAIADGGGGGGGGGTIVLIANQVVGSLSLEAKGGKGGNTVRNGVYDFGPGGGGGGGRIFKTNNTGILTNITGGGTGVNADAGNSAQTATAGSDGAVTTLTTPLLPSKTTVISRNVVIQSQPTARLICTGRTTNLSVSSTGSNLIYRWEINRNDGTGFVPLNQEPPYSGVATATLTISDVSENMIPFIYRCYVANDCNLSRFDVSDTVTLIIRPAPVPVFTPSVMANSNTVSFLNGSSNSLTYRWDFGDGSLQSTQTSPTHTYSAQGSFPVTLYAQNICDTLPTTRTIVLNSAPLCNFNSTSVGDCVPVEVQFTNFSSNNTVSYAWEFPGGTPAVSTDINPIVRYNASGLYDVVLVAVNGNGRDTLVRRRYIRANGAPQTDFDVVRNGSTFSFVNRTLGGGTYSWSFGDGRVSNQINPQHTYGGPGTYVVVLTATNACGSATSRDTVRLLSLPSARISVTQTSGCAPMVVQFSGQNASSVSNWSWQFVGGTPATSSLPNPRVTYSAAGTYSVILTVSNEAGSYTTNQDSFLRVQTAPNASFNHIVTRSTVEFFNNSTGATNYLWDFGDGTTSSLASPPPKTYVSQGTRVVTLQALNSACGAATTQPVTIVYATAVSNAAEKNDVVLSPNPTTGEVFISFESEKLTDKWEAHFLSADGKTQLQKKLDPTQQVQSFDIGLLPSGVYFVRIFNEKKTYIRKLVKI